MKKIFLTLALLLTACGEGTPRAPLTVHKITPYNTAPKIKTYGPWYVNNCALVAGNQDFSVSTTGRYNQGTLRMKIQTVMPLTRPPKITINTLDTPIHAEGKHRTYGFNLPFNGYQVAKMTTDHSYLFIHYTPLNKAAPLEGFLALAPLLKGLGALNKTCK